MKNIIVAMFTLFCSVASFAQISTVSVNKPLAFLNPALQNYDTDKGVVSASVLINPFKEEAPEANYLILGEYKINDDFRAGIHASKVSNRLNSNSAYKAYLSYRLELEKENYLIIGADFGIFNDMVKSQEFNKVLSPNKFLYTDSVAKGTDFGLGIAYSYSGFTFGLGFSKLNSPQVYLFPEGVYELKYTYNQDSSVVLDSNVQLKDTSIVQDEKKNFGLQSNINVMYEWNPNDKLKLIHSIQVGNLDLERIDYFSFQNIAIINDRHSLGLGVFDNGNLGFNLSAGYGITSDIKIEASAFFSKDFNWDAAQKIYVNSGYKPALELNARFEF
jgi:hypothetical protein